MENKDFFKNLNHRDINDLVKNIDKKIEELNQEEQEMLTKEILSGNVNIIPQKVDKLYNLSELYTWVIEDIQKIENLFENDNTLKEQYKEEYFALKILKNIYNSLFNASSKVSAELYDAIFALRNHSKSKERINALLKHFPITEENIDFYSLISDLIKHDATLFEEQYIKKIADLFYNLDDPKEALELYQLAIDSTKDNKRIAILYNDIGCCYIELSMVDSAIESFYKSIEIDKQYACAYNNLAYTLAVECDTIEKNDIWEGKLNEALKLIEIAIAVGSEDDSYYTNKVQIEYELGKYKETISDCNKGCEKFRLYSYCKTLIKIRILSQLEQYEFNANENSSLVDEVFKDLESIFSNEKGDDKYFYQGFKVYRKADGLKIEKLKKISFWLILLEFNIDKVKKELVVRDLDKSEIAYYTSLKNLYHILSDEESETKYRMPLFDVNYMNDPNEGIALQNYISDLATHKNFLEILKPISNNIISSVESEGFTFLKSFSKVVDALPMWVQYGDDGKGCCIKINPFFFTNFICQSKSSEKLLEASPFKDKYELYNVVYIDKTKLQNKNPKIHRLLKRIAQILDNIVESLSECDPADKELVNDLVRIIITSIKYLFKDSAYEHEQEMRIIINRNRNCLGSKECDIKTTNQSPIPKIFVPSVKSLQIDEIILDPKILSTNNYVPYISMQLSKMGEKNKNSAIITKSKICYR